jgi:hypothetical protein
MLYLKNRFSPYDRLKCLHIIETSRVTRRKASFHARKSPTSHPFNSWHDTTVIV